MLEADIELQNIMDQEFIGNVIYGSPPQKVDVMFDTGSASTWVYLQEGCEKVGHVCPNVNKYSTNLSDT